MKLKHTALLSRLSNEDYVLGKVSEVMYNDNVVDYNNELNNINERLNSLY